jgi:anti-sigma regulatory factor (Ser/Thr protein kinase)
VSGRIGRRRSGADRASAADWGRPGASVPRIRHELEHALRHLRLAPPQRQDIAIVVTEAATNVVAHAYTDTGPGPPHVSATLARRTLVFTVADAGHGMRPRRDSPGLGSGLVLMSRLCDALTIAAHRASGGTRVSASFQLPTAPALAPDEHGGRIPPHDPDALGDYVHARLNHSRQLRAETRARIAQVSQALRRAERLAAQSPVGARGL